VKGTLAFFFLSIAAAGFAEESPLKISPRAPEQGEVAKSKDKGILRGKEFDFLDRTKNQIYLIFAENLQIIDSVASGGEEVKDKTFQNEFRFSPYLVIDGSDTTKVDLELDFSASIHLRRLQKKLKLIIDNGELAPLPGTQPDEESQEAQIGLQKEIRKYVSARIGTKIGWPPVGYAIVSTGKEFRAEEWHITPSANAFYQTDDNGFGTGQNLYFGRWWDRYMFKSSSGIRITEATQGFEWASELTLARVVRLIEPSKDPPLISSRSMNQGLDLAYRISGHISGSKTIDEHRVTLTYRYPIRKNWMFLVVSPEIRWERSNNWVPDERIRIGVDILFWGVTR